MTQEINDISERFSFLKNAAQECLNGGGEFPDGIETQTDIRYFNDLLNLYSRKKEGLLSRSGAMAEDMQMRANYIERVRSDRAEKLKIKRSGQAAFT